MVDVKSALKRQYHAALAMLWHTIEACPDVLWAERGPRSFGRVAYHALFYSHLYLMPAEADFRPWDLHEDGMENTWATDDELAAMRAPYSRQEILSYWKLVDGMVDEAVDRLDLDSQESGFWWYGMPKIDHQLVNLRHINEHSGQLGERLMAAGIDPKWVSGHVWEPKRPEGV